MVFKKTQCISSADKHFSAKLAPRTEEPAKITKALSSNTYEIDSPNRLPKAHVSQLRRWKPFF